MINSIVCIIIVIIVYLRRYWLSIGTLADDSIATFCRSQKVLGSLSTLKKICKARNVVERFFGVLKSMWRCLSYQRVLMYSPGMAGKIVNACATLHNIRLHCNLPAFEDFDAIAQENNTVEHQPAPEFDPALGPNERAPRAIAQRIQKQIMLEQFGNCRDGNDNE